MKLGYVAFATVTALGVATGGSAFAAATAATTAGTVAYAALAILGSALSISSISAWFSPDTKDVDSYFKNMKHHAGYVLPGTVTWIAHSLMQAVVDGVVRGVRDLVYNKISSARQEQRKL